MLQDQQAHDHVNKNNMHHKKVILKHFSKDEDDSFQHSTSKKEYKRNLSNLKQESD